MFPLQEFPVNTANKIRKKKKAFFISPQAKIGGNRISDKQRFIIIRCDNYKIYSDLI